MNLLKLSVNRLEMTEKGVELNNNIDDLMFDFNENIISTLKLPPEKLYNEISLNNVTNPFLLILTSDNVLNAKINGFEFVSTKRLVLNIPIQSVEIANVSLYEAKVKIEIYGEQ